MQPNSHYATLNIRSDATPGEIKQAYRRLVKQFHPDSGQAGGDRETIIQLNAAYEVLNDPQRRSAYDRQCWKNNRPYRTNRSQHRHPPPYRAGKEADLQIEQWLREVFQPVNQLIWEILNPLDSQIDCLAADPFDDCLMQDFEDYLQACRQALEQAQQVFASQPNPSNLGGIAANLYYCLDRIGDGLEELGWFVLNYDDRHLHTGTELFRIAHLLCQDAQNSAHL